MDRNTLIALALVLAIWLLWPKWMELLYGKPEPAPVTTETAIDSSMAPMRSLPAEQPSVNAAPDVEPQPVREAAAAEGDVELRRIVIDAERYTAVISNRGAVIRSWELKEYDLPEGGPVPGGGHVDLLPPDGRGLGILLGAEGRETDLSRTMFDVDAAADLYTLNAGDSVTVRFTCDLSDGRTVYKRFTFRGAGYTARFDAGVLGGGATERMTVSWRGGVPPAEREYTTEMPHMKAQAYVGESLETIQFKKEAETSRFVGLTDWIAVRNKYFLAAFAPVSSGQSEVELQAHGIPGVESEYGWDLAPFDLTQTSVSGLVYLGPIDVDRLMVNGHNLERAADLGWAVIRPISKVVLWTFLGLYKIIPNYGLVVVIFSLFVKVLLHPLTKKSYESTSKMQTLKPLMEEIRAKYKDDQKKLNEEMMKLYKEEGFNPLGGCLPMVLQMPIIFAIYAVLGNNIEFRQAPFFAWISDLSAPDTLLILPFTVPFYGSNFNVLPILMAGSMFFQQKLMLTDPKQKMMVYIMPVIMLFVFNRLSSGLVLYWFMFNILSAGHQYYLMRKKSAEGEPAPAVAGSGKALVAQQRGKPGKGRKR